MRKFLALTVLLCAASAFAQAAKKVTLTWTDIINPSSTTYNVYRATGNCSGTPAFSVIQSAVAVKTYVDNSVTVGNYCYKVTAVASGVESSGSNTVNPVVAPSEVSLSATVN